MMKRTNLFVATATAALLAGSGMVLGQGMQGGQQGGAVKHESSGADHSLSTKGSNARGEQGTTRRSEQPGDKGSNARSAQGAERSSKPLTTGQAQPSTSKQSQDRPSSSKQTTGQGGNELREHNDSSKLRDRDSSKLRDRDSSKLRDRDQSKQSTGQSSKSRTTGQGQTERSEDRTRVNEDRTRVNEDQRTRGSESTRIESERSGGREGASLQLNDEQRSRIREVFVRHHDIPRVTHLDVDVRPGVVLHRRVHFVAVPSDVIRIYPQFRHYRVFMTGDEIVIVDPATLRIVAVLPA
jgi:hypothetical protein